MGDAALHLRGVSAVDGSTKAKIERAAVTLFADRGIDGVSTKQIAAKAGVSEGAIYRHFSSKEELSRALMLTIHERLTEMIRAASVDHDNITEQVRFIVRHYCRIADEDWTLFQYHILHLHHFPRLSDGPLDSPPDSPLSAAENILSEAMARKDIPASEPNILAAMALGVVLQAAQAKVFGYIGGPLSGHIDLFTRAVFAVLETGEGG